MKRILIWIMALCLVWAGPAFADHYWRQYNPGSTGMAGESVEQFKSLIQATTSLFRNVDPSYEVQVEIIPFMEESGNIADFVQTSTTTGAGIYTVSGSFNLISFPEATADSPITQLKPHNILDLTSSAAVDENGIIFNPVPVIGYMGVSPSSTTMITTGTAKWNIYLRRVPR